MCTALKKIPRNYCKRVFKIEKTEEEKQIIWERSMQLYENINNTYKFINKDI